jgi:hypothetical protein
MKATKFPMILLDHRVKGDNPIYKLIDEHHTMVFLTYAMNEGYFILYCCDFNRRGIRK